MFVALLEGAVIYLPDVVALVLVWLERDDCASVPPELKTKLVSAPDGESREVENLWREVGRLLCIDRLRRSHLAPALFSVVGALVALVNAGHFDVALFSVLGGVAILIADVVLILGLNSENYRSRRMAHLVATIALIVLAIVVKVFSVGLG